VLCFVINIVILFQICRRIRSIWLKQTPLSGIATIFRSRNCHWNRKLPVHVDFATENAHIDHYQDGRYRAVFGYWYAGSWNWAYVGLCCVGEQWQWLSELGNCWTPLRTTHISRRTLRQVCRQQSCSRFAESGMHCSYVVDSTCLHGNWGKILSEVKGAFNSNLENCGEYNFQRLPFVVNKRSDIVAIILGT